MRKKLLIASTYLLVLAPLSVPNNRVGVHILDTAEVGPAAKLVNSSGGDWGYVTIVLRSNDLDRDKWTKFFADCRNLHLIPLVRLATYPGPADAGWVKPDALDLVDFANFLVDMPWPVKNRYVILFNEVNHAAEWGGQVNPVAYATLLLDAQRVFKQRSADFFLLSAGLDMSSAQSDNSWDALTYYRQMSKLQPQWYDSVDGLAVHAYPNPAFSSSPTSTTRFGVRSFQYEEKLFKSLGYPVKPIFITETGWPHDQPFFNVAFTQAWQDPNIVAITPFLLYAGSGDFAQFSLLNPNQSPKLSYQEIYHLSKNAGSPLLGETTLTSYSTYQSGAAYTSPALGIWDTLANFWARLLGQQRLAVGATVFDVDVAQTESQREKGLSGRTSMGGTSGMLFVFDHPSQYQFWMKDMHFGLDFVWVRGGKVVQVTTGVPPPDQTSGKPQIITPQEKVDQVVEVNMGTIDKYGIKVGDLVRPR